MKVSEPMDAQSRADDLPQLPVVARALCPRSDLLYHDLQSRRQVGCPRDSHPIQPLIESDECWRASDTRWVAVSLSQ